MKKICVSELAGFFSIWEASALIKKLESRPALTALYF
jgi:hypothetical protein